MEITKAASHTIFKCKTDGPEFEFTVVRRERFTGSGVTGKPNSTLGEDPSPTSLP